MLKTYKQQCGKPRIHVQVWVAVHGPVPKGHHIDHINGNIHDNRIENLRLATVSQNICNSKLAIDNKTGLKGLTWDPRRCRYRGSVVKDKKQHMMRGDLFEVACWIFSTRLRLHGEFARFR